MERIGFALWGLFLAASLVLLFLTPFSVADLGKMAAYTIVFATALILDRLGLSQSVLEFRERGLLYKLVFWPWENVKDHNWTDGGSTLRLKLYGLGFAQFRLDPSIKDELDALLEAHRRATGGVIVGGNTTMGIVDEKQKRAFRLIEAAASGAVLGASTLATLDCLLVLASDWFRPFSAQAISVLGVCLGATVSYRRALDVEKD